MFKKKDKIMGKLKKKGTGLVVMTRSKKGWKK